MESAIMVLVLKEKKEGDPIKRYTITLPLSSLPLF
jgi:hypothetical protein